MGIHYTDVWTKGRLEKLALKIAELCNVMGRRELEIKHSPAGEVVHETAIASLEAYVAELSKLLEERKEIVNG